MRETAADRARAFQAFCDGLEDCGLIECGRRGRVVADDLLRALAELDAERSARRAIQERHEGLLERVCGPYPHEEAADAL